MNQLKDFDIVEKILKQELVVNGLPEPWCNLNTDDDLWYSKDSPVQPASLDLHVGNITVPEKGNESYDSYCLCTGQTIIVTTSEELYLPSNLSGFGFPPDKLSQKGVLMINLGHIDPGWHGKIKFVLINFGKSPFPIEKGGIVATFIFNELDQNVKKSYSERRPTSSFPLQPNIEGIVKTLSSDFLNVDKRAERIAAERSKRSTLIASIISACTAILVTVIGLLFSNSYMEKIKNLEIEVLKVNKDFDYKYMRSEMDSLKIEFHKIITKGEK